MIIYSLSVSVTTNTVISFVVEISVQKQVSVIGVEAAVKLGMEHVPISDPHSKMHS